MANKPNHHIDNVNENREVIISSDALEQLLIEATRIKHITWKDLIWLKIEVTIEWQIKNVSQICDDTYSSHWVFQENLLIWWVKIHFYWTPQETSPNGYTLRSSHGDEYAISIHDIDQYWEIVSAVSGNDIYILKDWNYTQLWIKVSDYGGKDIIEPRNHYLKRTMSKLSKNWYLSIHNVISGTSEWFFHRETLSVLKYNWEVFTGLAKSKTWKFQIKQKRNVIVNFDTEEKLIKALWL